jgi:hypothetical protein
VRRHLILVVRHLIYISLLKNFRIGFIAVSILLWNAILGTGIYLGGGMQNTHGTNSSFGIAFGIACIGFTTFFVSLFFSQKARDIALRPDANIESIRSDLQVLIFILSLLSVFYVVGWLGNSFSA